MWWTVKFDGLIFFAYNKLLCAIALFSHRRVRGGVTVPEIITGSTFLAVRLIRGLGLKIFFNAEW